jgi:hypothetical protein
MLDGVKSPCSGNLLIFTPIFKSHKRLLYALVVCALFTVPAIAADDDYLKALESEADDTGSLTQKPTNTQNATSPSSQDVKGVKNSAKENFEKLLEFELPSTYKFYTKLTPVDQNKVVRHYNQEKKMSTASKLIFDLYFESNK